MDEINTFRNYINNFISKPNSSLNGFAICPFAKTAEIDFKVFDTITSEEILSIFETHDKSKLLIIILKQATIQDLDRLAAIPIDGWVVFKGHPDDNFSINGVYTRKDPFPNIQFINKQHLLAGRSVLSEDYYKCWSPDNIKELGLS